MLAAIGIMYSYPDNPSNHQGAMIDLDKQMIKQLKNYRRLAKQAKKQNPKFYSHRYQSENVFATEFDGDDDDILERPGENGELTLVSDDRDWGGLKLYLPELPLLEVTEEGFSFNFMALDELGLMAMYETEMFTLDDVYNVTSGKKVVR